MADSYRVLEVGNCGFDHGRLSEWLGSRWDIVLIRASGMSQALRQLASDRFDLILANRVLEGDGRLGLDLLSELQASGTDFPPLVLLTDYADKQAEALAAGAAASFGKRQIGTESAVAALVPMLGAGTSRKT